MNDNVSRMNSECVPNLLYMRDLIPIISKKEKRARVKREHDCIVLVGKAKIKLGVVNRYASSSHPSSNHPRGPCQRRGKTESKKEKHPSVDCHAV